MLLLHILFFLMCYFGVGVLVSVYAIKYRGLPPEDATFFPFFWPFELAYNILIGICGRLSEFFESLHVVALFSDDENGDVKESHIDATHLIRVSEQFTKTPGARFKDQGPFSGEEFRETILKPVFLDAQEVGGVVVVDLDGAYGYPSGFLEEAFGGLARQLGSSVSELRIISTEEPSKVSEVYQYIADTLSECKELRS